MILKDLKTNPCLLPNRGIPKLVVSLSLPFKRTPNYVRHFALGFFQRNHFALLDSNGNKKKRATPTLLGLLDLGADLRALLLRNLEPVHDVDQLLEVLTLGPQAQSQATLVVSDIPGKFCRFGEVPGILR